MQFLCFNRHSLIYLDLGDMTLRVIY